MTFKVLLNLQSDPAKVDALKAWLDKNLPDTKAYDGCISVEVIEHDEDPNKITLIGSWESREKWETYIKWREGRKDFDVLAPLLKEEPDFQCYKLLTEWKTAI